MEKLLMIRAFTTGSRSLILSQQPGTKNYQSIMYQKTLGLLTLSFVIAGCNIDMSSLKDCKDKDGNSLPEWVCRKGDPDSKSSQ